MADPAPTTEVSTELFLGRQPILDAQGNLYAFELLFRSSRVNGAQIADEVAATATVIRSGLQVMGVEAVQEMR
jgi:EAL and modified HD-GYP domain-containing signal transduction protein